MRRLVLTVIVLQAAMLIAIRDVSARTAEELLPSCKAVLREARVVGPQQLWWVPDAGTACWNYLEAVHDMAAF